jgi:hypothetical protein
LQEAIGAGATAGATAGVTVQLSVPWVAQPANNTAAAAAAINNLDIFKSSIKFN